MKKDFVLFFVFLLFVSVLFVSLTSASLLGSWFTHSTGNAVVSTCIDSDNGKNYFAKGTVSGIDAKTNVQTSQSDRCADAKTLIEYYCDTSGKVDKIFTSCVSGCGAGICLGKAPTTTSSSTTTSSAGTTSATNEITSFGIYSVNLEEITSNGVKVVVRTTALADSQVEYGLTPSLGSATSFTTLWVNINIVPITGLSPETKYYYRVNSKDQSGNTATSDINFFVTATASSGITSFQPTVPFVINGECKSLLINGNPNDKIDMVVIPNGYLNNDEIDKFLSTAKEYLGLTGTNGLFNVEPFKTYKNKFNVYYVTQKSSLGCYGRTCDLDKLKEIEKLCPSLDEEIIIYNPNVYGLHSAGGSSHYLWIFGGSDGNPIYLPDLNITTYQIFYPNALVHEFGHSFGGLGDLYGPSAFSPVDVSWPNIDIFGCPKWCSGAPSVPEPNNQGCSAITTQTGCMTATFSPGCEWEGGKCMPLPIPNNQNVGSQCKSGYGCYQGAGGLAGYSSAPKENTLMGNHATPSGGFDPASYDHLVELLNKNNPSQKTCEQTRVLKKQTNLNRCVELETKTNVRSYFACGGSWRTGVSCKTYYDYNCVKTIQTSCSENATCPAGSVEKSSVACDPNAKKYTFVMASEVREGRSPPYTKCGFDVSGDKDYDSTKIPTESIGTFCIDITVSEEDWTDYDVYKIDTISPK